MPTKQAVGSDDGMQGVSDLLSLVLNVGYVVISFDVFRHRKA